MARRTCSIALLALVTLAGSAPATAEKQKGKAKTVKPIRPVTMRPENVVEGPADGRMVLQATRKDADRTLKKQTIYAGNITATTKFGKRGRAKVHSQTLRFDDGHSEEITTDLKSGAMRIESRWPMPETGPGPRIEQSWILKDGSQETFVKDRSGSLQLVKRVKDIPAPGAKPSTSAATTTATAPAAP